MLADFVRKTKTALAKTDVSSRHIAVSAPHQHTHTHTHTHIAYNTHTKQCTVNNMYAIQGYRKRWTGFETAIT